MKMNANDKIVLMVKLVRLNKFLLEFEYQSSADGQVGLRIEVPCTESCIIFQAEFKAGTEIHIIDDTDLRLQCKMPGIFLQGKGSHIRIPPGIDGAQAQVGIRIQGFTGSEGIFPGYQYGNMIAIPVLYS